MFFQMAEERVSRRFRHSSGTGFTGHERDEVTIKLCLRERGSSSSSWGKDRGREENGRDVSHSRAGWHGNTQRTHQESAPPLSREDPRFVALDRKSVV